MAQVLSDGGGDQLRRTITVPQGVALYLGTVVGAGVLLLPGLAARSPDAGGVATYAGQAFSAAASMVTGWFYFIPAATAQALVALTGVYYVAPCLGLGRAGIFAASGLILLVATAVNMRGITVSGRLQLGFSAIGTAGVAIFFAFFGWEAITHLSAECWDPARDVPRRRDLLPGSLTAFVSRGGAIAASGLAVAPDVSIPVARARGYGESGAPVRDHGSGHGS
jgi:amino acid efflux transporter